MVVCSTLSVQIGLALSVGMVDRIGVEGTAWLRLSWAGVLFLVLVRPRLSSYTPKMFRASVLLGVNIAANTLLFMAAVSRIPLATASALEFLGPLGVAIAHGKGNGRVLWPGLAAIGVIMLIDPWAGATDTIGLVYALCASLGWACYIVLTQHLSDRVAGVNALAISMPVAGLVATMFVGPAGLDWITTEIMLLGVGLAILLPCLPFALEMLALRRMNTTAFGTLMSLEPAFAMLIGVIMLHQMPGLGGAAGICCVVIAGIAAARQGARSSPPAQQDAESSAPVPTSPEPVGSYS
ncbi:EamA family transporter [Mycobacterium spongiae]|uniref:EamA family transporter n=1 Tax=Mycobacterium spongiae TaxID=886343 RepID=A0A975K1J2_9MYCO|nr:EamA family transporter [Mycobacterium spongiae]QUR69676.1 EamA family transporter [Mycobacterium spongiae]